MTSSADFESRLRALEGRVRELEDIQSIMKLIASYGPAVDSNSLTEATLLWTEDGAYDVDVPGRMEGRASIEAMLHGPGHQSLVEGGSIHQVTLPRVTLHGDRAVATAYQQLVRHRDGIFEIFRQSANRWELVRTEDGWRVHNRTNRLLDGRSEARSILAAAFVDSSSVEAT